MFHWDRIPAHHPVLGERVVLQTHAQFLATDMTFHLGQTEGIVEDLFGGVPDLLDEVECRQRIRARIDHRSPIDLL